MYWSVAYFNKGSWCPPSVPYEAIGKPIVLFGWSLLAYHLGELLSWWSLYDTTKGVVNFIKGFTMLDGPHR
ncbi:hypothetical protein RIR_jg25667.t1 [Rhizophagus irregularis DAOM 181602=DAOM 197198]|uniref:Uncharacterized protein n=1 Tax=Rhizophagus irregularis (strain DAOM 197198w) TaxID=1432141 RepID=A0A015MKW2_RHIIW|nr:hypothetical protein RirG_113930 [Rhizophagus irregularis DAOM 197198w]GBC43580.1 hypothetical protein RIR_jg25667.t1 [Rhizophagus irregularis DAOM 181602=DAOM 197198]